MRAFFRFRRFRRFQRWAVSLFGGACVLGFASAAGAEGAFHVGGRVGVATLSGSSAGPALELHGAYELSDMFDAVVQIAGSSHGGTPEATVLSASGGLAYKIDVFEWIPYVSVLGGYYRYAGTGNGEEPLAHQGSQVGASLHAGLHYLVSRELALGADVGWHASFQDGFSFPYFTALAGAEYRFGW